MPKADCSLRDLVDIHAGKKCFVVATGASILDQDLSGIHKHVVVAMNGAINAMPWTNGDPSGRYWISNDSRSINERWFSLVIQSKCTKLVRNSWFQQHNRLLQKNGFRYFCPRSVRPNESLKMYYQETHLSSVSTAPTSIDLAILMGCKQIYLLGIDHGVVNGRFYFWENTTKSPSHEQHQILKRNEVYFGMLKEYANRMGCVIKNCSPHSRITTFEYMDIQEAQKETA